MLVHGSVHTLGVAGAYPQLVCPSFPQAPSSAGLRDHGPSLRRHPPPPAPRRPARPSGRRRVPPHNLEAEESLLGAMLLSSDAIASAIETLHGRGLLQAGPRPHLRGHHAPSSSRGEPADAVTVTDELRRSGLLEAVGDPSVFVSLQANTPSIGQRRALRRASSRSTPCCAGWSAVAGEIAELGYSRARGRRRRAVDQAEQHGLRRGPAADGRHHVARCTSCSAPGSRPHRGALVSRGDAITGRGHRLPPTSTSILAGSAALEPDRRGRPSRPWGRPASPSASWPTPASSCSGPRCCSPSR